MEKPKVFELTADYQSETRDVALSLWRRGEREESGRPIDRVQIAIGQGYATALRIARRDMLARAGLGEHEVMGA